MNRRNSIISKSQYRNGMRVGTVLHMSGRFPRQGLRSDCEKNAILYIMKGSGMIARTNHKTALSAGSIIHLKHCEMYYLKGQMSLYAIYV